uniref:Acetyltransferase n=1 Tax=Setaria italica TaxID=4555 RepID=K3Y0V9_SETIT
MELWKAQPAGSRSCPGVSSGRSRQPRHRRPRVMHLTPCDLRVINFEYILKGVLLPNHRTRPASAVADGLASSLARALARSTLLLARLTAAEVTGSVSSGLVISLRCNGRGRRVRPRCGARGLRVSDIATPLYVPPVVRSFFPFNGVRGVDAVLESRPLLAGEDTELADGIFIAMSLNHGVADGTTLWHFFNTWSEISRSSSGGGEGYKLSTALPVLDRWFLDTCPAPIPLPFAKVEDIVQRPEYTPVQECFFHFSAEECKEAQGNGQLGDGRNGGDGDHLVAAVSSRAHVASGVPRPRPRATPGDNVLPCHRAPGTGEGATRLRRQRRDGRGRAVRRRRCPRDLDRGLGWPAWLLNRAVASFDEAREGDDLASWARNPSLLYLTPLRDPANVMTGSSPRFDMYGNDFGWGRPVAVRSGAENKVDGKVIVYEGRDGGGMALEVYLSPEAMSRLVADEEFMEAVSL